jgi:hypothetical protein
MCLSKRWLSMRREAGVCWRPLGTGVGFGLVAGLVGVVQWVLTARDLDERLAAFQAWQQTHPSAWDSTNVARGNEWFWVFSAAVAGVVMLALYGCAAFTTARASKRYQDAITAAWLAAAVSIVVYCLATFVAIATSSDPSTTKSVVPCEPAFGLELMVPLIPLASEAASLGARASGSFPRGRRA